LWISGYFALLGVLETFAPLTQQHSASHSAKYTNIRLCVLQCGCHTCHICRQARSMEMYIKLLTLSIKLLAILLSSFGSGSEVPIISNQPIAVRLFRLAPFCYTPSFPALRSSFAAPRTFRQFLQHPHHVLYCRSSFTLVHNTLCLRDPPT